MAALDGGLGVRIRKQDEEVVVPLREGAEGSMAAGGVTTDARIAVVRRAGAAVSGAAVLDGTRLVAAGDGELLSSAHPAFLGGVRLGDAWTSVEGGG